MLALGFSHALVLSSILLPILALPQSNDVGGSCFDGRLCSCQTYLDDLQYKVVQRRVNCLTQLGAEHHFLKDSQEQITQDVCEFYFFADLGGANLISCVYKEIGMIINIDGVDQWDLDNMRVFYIDMWIKELQLQDDPVLSQVIFTTFLVCPADPLDFTKIPLDDCWRRATKYIEILLKEKNGDAESLSGGSGPSGALDLDLVKTSMGKEYDRGASAPNDVTEIVMGGGRK